jgi:Polysaccharide lyase
MKARKILCWLSFVAATSLSYGSVIFENDGSISPWGHLLKDSGASLTQVSSPTYKGSSALKHYANFSGTGDVSVHCEVARDPAGQIGDSYYYGWAFRLGSDFPSSSSVGSVICQLTARGSCWNQLDFLQCKGSTLADYAGDGDSCNPSSHVYTISSSIPSRNVWHRMEIHKIWATGNTGMTHIWLDGTIKVQVDNVRTAFTDGMGTVAWHVGLYAGFVYGTPDTRTVWTDHARIATSYNEADPTQW